MISLLAVYSLWRREIVRFYRQPNRVIGALGSPLVFWVLIGSGIGTSFQSQAPGASKGYLGFFFPGTLLMVILFTAIFSTISIIEDRKEGFLQGVLVSPASRFSITLGKVFGGATLALAQAAMFLIISPMLGIHLDFFQWVLVLMVLTVIAISLTSLGFVIAWQMESIQGFHAIMNLFLMPLWFLSGALFPAEGASGWIQVMMKINPLYYQMHLLKLSLYANSLSPNNHGIGFSVLIALGFCVFILFLANFFASRNVKG